jgi:branched-chain amino acid transport system substrate-binding protein
MMRRFPLSPLLRRRALWHTHPRFTRHLSAALCLAAMSCLSAGGTLAAETLKIGIVGFFTGGAAGTFGIPARNGSEIVIDALNAGTVPAPYASKGIAGARIEPVYVDESGGTAQVVTEFRNLVQRQDVHAVMGFVSSGSCLGVAPVAEELKTLTIFSICGTPRIFEEGEYRYVFRTKTHATADSVAAARYVARRMPDIKRVGGINQNYSWGKDSWGDFTLALRHLLPAVQLTTEQFPKLFAGQYSSEISALLVSRSDLVHSSFWGADFESFILQAGARGLAQRTTLLFTAAENSMFRLGEKLPNGVIMGAEGPYGLFAPDTALNRWFREEHQQRYGVPAVYPAYVMAQSVLALKAAYEKAAAARGGSFPTTEQAIDALKHLTFASPGGEVRMALGKGHQAVTGHAYGIYQWDAAAKQGTFVDVEHFAAACVNPPEGVKSQDWLQQGMPGAQCE